MIFLIENFELFPFQMLHKSFASLHTEFQMFIFTPFILLTNGPCLSKTNNYNCMKKATFKKKKHLYAIFNIFFTNVSSLKTFHKYSSDWHCFDLFAYFNSIWWSSLASVLSSFNCLICSVFPWYFKMFFFLPKTSQRMMNTAGGS